MASILLRILFFRTNPLFTGDLVIFMRSMQPFIRFAEFQDFWNIERCLHLGNLFCPSSTQNQHFWVIRRILVPTTTKIKKIIEVFSIELVQTQINWKNSYFSYDTWYIPNYITNINIENLQCEHIFHKMLPMSVSYLNIKIKLFIE